MTHVDLLQPAVLRRLRSLRLSLRWRLGVEALAWLVVATVAYVFVTMGLDYVLRVPERPLRAVGMLLGLIPIVWVAWRHLVRPLRVTMDTDNLALLVEQGHPALGDRLISALQFDRLSDPAAAGSPAMVRKVADEANDLLGGMDLKHLVERVDLRRAVSLAACAAGLLVGFAFWQAPALSCWYQRNVLLADVYWPQQTYLRVEGKVLDSDAYTELGDWVPVYTGEALAVRVTTDSGSRRPSQVLFHAKYPSVGATEDAVDPGQDGNFHHTLTAITEPITFHVTGGDDRRDAQKPHSVVLVQRPAAETISFTVQDPAYTRRGAQTFDGSQTELAVLAGSTLQVELIATRDLREASLTLDGRSESMSPGKTPRRWRAATTVGTDKARSAVDLQMSLIDKENHRSAPGRIAYRIYVQPDQPPTVQVVKRGIGTAITPEAVIPLSIVARDDFGVADLAIVPGIKGAAAALKPQAVALPEKNQPRAFVEASLDLRGLGLVPGSVLQIVVRAGDVRSSTFGGPNIGSSDVIELQVVRPETLRTELIRRQKALRLEFLETIRMQRDAQAKTASAAARTPEQLAPEHRRLLTSSAAIERNVGAECTRVGREFADILEEMLNNRLIDEPGGRAFRDEIVDPLAELPGQIARVAEELDSAAELPAANEMLPRAVDLAGVQDRIRIQMEAIADAGAKAANRQEVANELGLIIEESLELLRRMQEAGAVESGGIFKPPATQPATAPAP